MFGKLAAVIGILLAAWMSAGRWLFGAGGELTLWYLPTIGLLYSILAIWQGIKHDRARAAGTRIIPSAYVTLALSWLCAIIFGFTVPDSTAAGLESIISHLAAGDRFAFEMSAALCNPLGIIAFVLLAASLIIIHACTRPRPQDLEE